MILKQLPLQIQLTQGGSSIPNQNACFLMFIVPTQESPSSSFHSAVLCLTDCPECQSHCPVTDFPLLPLMVLQPPSIYGRKGSWRQRKDGGEKPQDAASPLNPSHLASLSQSASKGTCSTWGSLQCYFPHMIFFFTKCIPLASS